MFRITHVLTQKITRRKLDAFMRAHASNSLTLDLGAGNSPYRTYFPNRISADIDRRLGIDVVCDAHNLPFAADTFEIVVCTEVLEHLINPHSALKEIRRVLKPGGRLLLTTRFIFPIHDAPGDFFRFTAFGLRHLLDNGWEILELHEEADAQETLAILLQRIVYQGNLRGGKLTKFILLSLALALERGPRLIKAEFMDISKEIRGLMLTSGYYLVARKV